MTTRRRRWFAIGLVLVPLFAGLIPGSPLYLPDLYSRYGHSHDGHGLGYWRDALGSPDAEVRRQGAVALGAMGGDAADAVPALAARLTDDPDAEVRHQAALALMKVGPAASAAVPALAKALADEEPAVRMNAVLALSPLRGEARAAAPALIRALGDDANQTNLETFSFTIQEAAALALARATAGSDEGVPALREALVRGRTEGLRKAAARALGEVGSAAQSAAPQLRDLLSDNSQDLQEVARDALRQITGTSGEEAAPSRPAGEPEDLRLAEAETAYLWDVEHHGNLLVKHGFGPIARALKAADGEALTRLLADDFSGTDLREPRRIRAAPGYAEVERLEDSGRPPLRLDRAAFVARLLEWRKIFATKPPEVKLALMALSPHTRGNLAGPWEGTAQVRMYGESAEGAPAEVVLMLRYELAPPTEKSLSQPGWLRGCGVTQVLTARAPRYLFAEVAEQRGLDRSKLHDNWKADRVEPQPGGVYVCDFDRDGILDVLVTDLTGVTLYRGRPGGTFEDVTERYGLPRAPSGTVAAWVDIDGDGWEDLILGRRVYRNEAGKHFADTTARCNLRLPDGASGVVVADYDRDGKVDLYVTRAARPGGHSWLDGRSGDSDGNFLFRNKGDWQFEDVTRASKASGGYRSSFTAAWLDVNNDGWPDLHVINEFGDGVLLVNNHDGTFSERRLADGPADFGSMGLAVGDIDNDGNIDIYCANMYSKAGTRVIGNLAPDAYPPEVMGRMKRFVAGSQLHMNKGGLKFDQVGQARQVAGVGWAYGACLADLDNDGWLDLYATAGFISRSRDEPDG